MAINPHRKGGPDVPVADGGTSASDAATARANIGAGDLDTPAHALIDHTGLPGISSGGSLTLIERKEFLVDTASYSFTGLDGNADEVYVIQSSILHGVGGGNHQIYAKPNGLGLGGNFSGTFGEFNGFTITTGALSVFWLSVTADAFPDWPTQTVARFDASFNGPGATTRRRRWWATINYFNQIEFASCTWNEKTVNVTSILIDALTGVIGAGSIVTLYKTTL